MTDIQRLKIDFSDWESLSDKAPTKVINRLMTNLKPLAIINTVMYIEYVGPTDKKEVFSKYFKEERHNLESYFSAVYKTNRILGSKELSQEKLEWLKSLMEIFKPKHVHFNIMES